MIPLQLTDTQGTAPKATTQTGDIAPIKEGTAFTEVFDLLQTPAVTEPEVDARAEVLLLEDEAALIEAEEAPLVDAMEEDEVEDTLTELVAGPVVLAPKDASKPDGTRTDVPTRSQSSSVQVDSDQPTPPTPKMPALTQEPQRTSMTVQQTAAQSMVEGRFPQALPEAGMIAVSAKVVASRPSTGERILQVINQADTTANKAFTTIKSVDELIDPKVAVAEKEHLDVSKEGRQMRDLPQTEIRVTAATPATKAAGMTPAISAPLVATQVDLAGKATVRIEGQAEPLAQFATGERAAAVMPSATAAPSTAGVETARHVANQLAVAIGAQPGRATEIALYPRELGRVRLSMTAVDTSITLTVLADRPETADLMRRHIETLSQEFKSLGYDDISFSFGGGDQAEADSQSEHENELNGPAASDVVEIENGTTQQQLKTGLDLRL